MDLDALKFLLLLIIDAWLLARLTKWLYPNRGDFLESLRYWFQPGWLSLLRGEFGSDVANSFKLFGLILCAFLLITFELFGLRALGEWVRTW